MQKHGGQESGVHSHHDVRRRIKTGEIGDSRVCVGQKSPQVSHPLPLISQPKDLTSARSELANHNCRCGLSLSTRSLQSFTRVSS